MAPTAAGGPGVPSSSTSAASGMGGGAKGGMTMGALGGGGGGGGGIGPGLAGGGSPGPEPRWKHTATVIDESRILIFGGYKSSSQRCVAFYVGGWLLCDEDSRWTYHPSHPL